VAIALALKYDIPVMRIYEILVYFFKVKLGASLVLDLW
jgi:hypothetical protein